MIEANRITDVNMFDEEQSNSLLMVACESGDVTCVEMLLDNNSVTSNIRQNLSIMKSICRRGDTAILKLLLERGLTLDDHLLLSCFIEDVASKYEMANIRFEHIIDVNYHDDDGDNFSRRACKAGNVSLAAKLLEKGADRDKTSIIHGGCLYTASANRHTEVVKLLLSWDAQGVRIPSESLRRALKSASYLGLIDILRLVVEYGVGLDDLSYALCQAAICNQSEVAEYLIDSGADIDATTSGMRSIFCLACPLDFTCMARLLLSRGANPNAQVLKESPLKAALVCPAIVRTLLEAGADPNLPLADGDMVLIHAIRISNSHPHTFEVLKLLLGHGADPNLAHASTGERTPLMIAAVYLRVDMVRLLLEHGADVTQVNSEGKCVLGILDRTRKYREVVELCTSYI